MPLLSLGGGGAGSAPSKYAPVDLRSLFLAIIIVINFSWI